MTRTRPPRPAAGTRDDAPVSYRTSEIDLDGMRAGPSEGKTLTAQAPERLFTRRVALPEQPVQQRVPTDWIHTGLHSRSACADLAGPVIASGLLNRRPVRKDRE